MSINLREVKYFTHEKELFLWHLVLGSRLAHSWAPPQLKASQEIRSNPLSLNRRPTALLNPTLPRRLTGRQPLCPCPSSPKLAARCCCCRLSQSIYLAAGSIVSHYFTARSCPCLLYCFTVLRYGYCFSLFAEYIIVNHCYDVHLFVKLLSFLLLTKYTATISWETFS